MADRSAPPWGLPPDPAGRNLTRILKLDVPLTVVIAEQSFPIARLLELQPGKVLEFDKPFDAPLELMIDDRRIATGQAVLVGDRFGLRIGNIRDKPARIKSLGP